MSDQSQSVVMDLCTYQRSKCSLCGVVFEKDVNGVKNAYSALLDHFREEHVGLGHTCGRRYDAFSVGRGVKHADFWINDSLMGITCCYCGSISPEEFFKLVQEGKEVTPTDKGYKAYIDGDKKFYFQHLTLEDRQTFIDLYNSKKMRLAHPGHFYTRPFFVTFKPVDQTKPT